MSILNWGYTFTATYRQQEHAYNHTYTAPTLGPSRKASNSTKTKRIVHSLLLILQNITDSVCRSKALF